MSICYFASCHLSCEIATMDNGRIRTLVSANVPRVLRCSRWGYFFRVDKVPKRGLRRLRPPASSAYHIDNALRLMRNNYNLFAHHSKTKKKKKRYLSARCLSSIPTPPYSPLSLLTPCRSVAFSCLPNDECGRWWWRPKSKKKGGDTCFIYLYFAVGAQLVASRQNFKVGIINSNAPFWVTQLGSELGMEMAMETKLVSMSRCDDESRWWLM